MKTIIKTTLLVLTWASQLTNAQLFGDDSKEHSWYAQLGLSQACVDAYNTPVSCDKSLIEATNFDWAPGGELLDSDSLAKLCVPKCHNELQDLRKKIISTCNEQTDLIEKLNWYPATFLIDHYIYGYDASCRKDKNTGQMCALYVGNLQKQNKDPDNCSDCILAGWVHQLNSPLSDYDYDGQVEQFESIKSECGTVAESYTFTKSLYGYYSEIPMSSTLAKPMPTSTRSTTSGAPAEATAPAPTCDQKDGAQNGTCNAGGTSSAQRAPTGGLMALNTLALFWGIAIYTHHF